MPTQSKNEAAFLSLLSRYPDIPTPVAEYVFAPPRKWRFDFVWTAEMLAVEVDGAVFTAGRHARGAGIVADAEKYEAALLRGWTVYRIPSRWIVGTPAQKREEAVIDALRTLLRNKAYPGNLLMVRP